MSRWCSPRSVEIGNPPPQQAKPKGWAPGPEDTMQATSNGTSCQDKASEGRGNNLSSGVAGSNGVRHAGMDGHPAPQEPAGRGEPGGGAAGLPNGLLLSMTVR